MASILVMLAMGGYEFIKQSLWPRISIWESHLITIGFSAVCGGVASFWVTTRLHHAFRQIIEQNQESERLRRELETTLAELKTSGREIESLSSLLPVCAWCRKIQDEEGHWHSLEGFVSRHSKTQVSHGMCPECSAAMTKHLPKEDGFA